MCGAARMATWLASDHLDFRGDDAVASAWLRRGRALLRDREPCAELGYIMLLDADIALLAKSDPPTAERLAREALELARGIEDVGVEVVALALIGCALVACGAVDEGVQSLDECAALAVGEKFAENGGAGVGALPHGVGVRRRRRLRARRAVVPRPPRVVGGLAGPALLRRLPHGPWRSARDQRRIGRLPSRSCSAR